MDFSNESMLPKHRDVMATRNGSSSKEDKSGKTGVTVNEYPHFDPPSPLEWKVAVKASPSIKRVGQSPTPAQVFFEYTSGFDMLLESKETE